MNAPDQIKAISFKDAWLKYRVDFRENGKVTHEDFWALKGINLEINKGEVVGLIGENGAGKTSILKLIAGMLIPDKGRVEVKGAVSALMEIGAGLHKDLTGRENVYLVSSLFGLNKAQVDERFDDILRFAGIGRFINAPVRIYSQGMYMRLAFAIAIHVNPDILLLDDMFVVGDIYAQQKCINKIFELKEKGMTILFALQDLEMLKRICSRGIFLRDGMLIKEGPIATACSYYTETVGNREGIVVTQKGPLGVIFNNGKLILKWKGKTITCSLGGHSSMLISGREYLSTTASWQVRVSKDEGEIVGTGRWTDIPVVQYWKIKFLNEKEFSWEVSVEKLRKVDIEKIDIRNFFIDEYKSWFTLDDQKDFPGNFMSGIKEDCAVIDESANGFVGLKGNGSVGKEVPMVIFDRLHDNTRAICQAGNTGPEIRGRIIQHQIFSAHQGAECVEGKRQSFSNRVRIFGPEENEGAQGHLEEVKQTIRESTIIRKGPLSLCCRNQKIEIYWRDRLLTRDIGINTKFKCQDREYAALTGHWKIQKKNSEEIIITISWDDGGSFLQVWRLTLPAEDTILWTIEMNSLEKIKLRNKQAELVLSEEYERWMTAEEQGGFERLEKSGSTVVLNKYVNTCIGVEGIVREGDFFLPAIVFNQEAAAPYTSFISKKKETGAQTILRYLAVDSQKDFYTASGTSVYFKGKIQVKTPDRPAPVIRNGIDHPHELKLNRLSVIFDHGKGRFFWGGKELTKGLGMYSSVFFNNISYDSSQAFWEIVESNGNKLKVTGNWCWIPMMQTWEISLLDETTIAWRIDRTGWEDFSSDKEQVNIMLSDAYKKWFIPKELSESFPVKFREHSGNFWDRLWCRDGALTMGIKKCKSLPSLSFSCLLDCQVRYSAIENTDDLFQARVLQYELYPDSKGGLAAEKYFSGQIKIIT